MPCVVTDVGDSALIVGPLGTVVAPGDPAALAGAWRLRLDSLGAVRPHELRSRVEREFSVRALVDRTEQTLREVVSTAAPARGNEA